MQINNVLTPIASESATRKPHRVQAIRPDAPAQDGKPGGAPSLVVSPTEDDVRRASQYQTFSREQGNPRSQSALATYQSLEKQSQREQIQSMFGVDTYA
ncbi:hypothetical protein [Alteromonas sp. CYL-A6]|uniref:hypothetical protein n=1 Tax=Alteromonas nitratireducens TaxID=3390813 RepID=UPI0034C32E6E